MIERIAIKLYKNGESRGVHYRLAVRVGPFAIHRAAEMVSIDFGPYKPMAGWRVTHVASGRKTQPEPLCCFAHANAVEKVLAGLECNWSFGELQPQKRAIFPLECAADMRRARNVVRSMGTVCAACTDRSILKQLRAS